jgi:cysteine synthase A
MKIVERLTDLIGHTPLLELDAYRKRHQLTAKIIVKIESFNPGGSSKDRAALYMIETAEQQGLLKPGAEIIEPTSGNTGVGLAWIAAIKGYKLTLTMPETMSIERRRLLKAYGANLVLTPGAEGMSGAIKKANELKALNPNSYIPQQFENPANVEAHRQTTAEEIWRDTDGKVAVFVAGVGSGGTISGTGARLKKLNPAIRTVAVEPASSPVLSGGKAGAHKIQGIGANFVPKIYNKDVVDEVFPVTDEDAIRTGRELAQKDGLLVGISSGAAVYAASVLATRPENKDKFIVVFLPDTGERYLSSVMFAEA